MNVEKYCCEKFDKLWESKIPDHEKVHASGVLREGYDFIAKKVKGHHGELTPDAVRDIAILEGFLVTFVQHATDKDQLNKIGAIVG